MRPGNKLPVHIHATTQRRIRQPFVPNQPKTEFGKASPQLNKKTISHHSPIPSFPHNLLPLALETSHLADPGRHNPQPDPVQSSTFRSNLVRSLLNTRQLSAHLQQQAQTSRQRTTHEQTHTRGRERERKKERKKEGTRQRHDNEKCRIHGNFSENHEIERAQQNISGFI